MDIILASASPRRLEIFNKNGYDVTVMPAEVEENLPEGIMPQDAVMFLALKKALSIEERLRSEGREEAARIVAADTVVWKDEILGKPEDEADARRMLTHLNGKTHSVYTGTAVIDYKGSLRTVFYDRTEVEFVEYSDEDIDAYIKSGEPMDKAGAYAIQGGFATYIKEFRGSYLNVVGFPWEKYEKVIMDNN